VSYRRGRGLEYVVRDMFRRRGWFVIRAAASKPVDLVCLKGGKIVLVECKYGGRSVRWTELALPLLDVAERAKILLLAYGGTLLSAPFSIRRTSRLYRL